MNDLNNAKGTVVTGCTLARALASRWRERVTEVNHRLGHITVITQRKTLIVLLYGCE